MKKEIVMMVGPTFVPEKVLKAMNRKSISHRSEEYCKIHGKVVEGLKRIFGTENEVLILTSSGTGAMEAAIQNCFSPGDQVVVPVIGTFSEQFAKMAESHQLKVVRVEFELGEAADVDRVMEYVTEETKGVFVIHNESSTGVTNDLESFGKALEAKNTLLITDSVSGAGGLKMKMDEWKIDVVLCGSQKALMVPAGLSFISLSQKAWKATKSSKLPKYYFDLNKAREFQKINQTPNTPAVYNVFAVEEALNMIFEEGLENVYKRHINNTNRIIEGVRKLGYDIFPKDDRYASKTLTAVYAPGKAKAIVKGLKEQGVIVNTGLSPIEEDVFRVGVMGYVFEEDVGGFIEALAKLS
ncbi:pyridoxal-phosphate-dependent aminotransferase family protein [Tepidimicrobium xylanilyticum]|uniref:Tritium exchange subunit n=1 Tax=Tepidimicrobium xylanilyticum TaxID=1123352 RepID=A0A1H3A3L8_9FIRM|nr:alanine--glyoxylate aminotransferase family protein [Tepidimicrobium xylanilyticum]GMG96336.1 class V aminotransferase [Tepidimicrobium xylanilyticum]SDX23808.1 aspartate aminotransferase [Tepidimicrobium xylanilyticum]